MRDSLLRDWIPGGIICRRSLRTRDSSRIFGTTYHMIRYIYTTISLCDHLNRPAWEFLRFDLLRTRCLEYRIMADIRNLCVAGLQRIELI